MSSRHHDKITRHFAIYFGTIGNGRLRQAIGSKLAIAINRFNLSEIAFQSVQPINARLLLIFGGLLHQSKIVARSCTIATARRAISAIEQSAAQDYCAGATFDPADDISLREETGRPCFRKKFLKKIQAKAKA